jgi:molybdopterin converting factor small subunit
MSTSTHTLVIRCFAKARELVNNTEITVNVCNNSDVNMLMHQITAQYPELKLSFLKTCKFAQNNKYVDNNTFKVTQPLQLTMIPPISGG